MLNFYSDTFIRLSLTNLTDVGQIGVTLIASILNYRVAVLLLEDNNKEPELFAIKELSQNFISAWNTEEDLVRYLWREIDSPTIVKCGNLKAKISSSAKRLGIEEILLAVPLKSTINHKEKRIGLAIAAFPPKNYELNIDIVTLDLIASLISGALTTCKMRTDLIEINKKLELDITERKKAEKLIDDALTFNKTIFEASPIGIITFKASGQCVSVNESLAEMVGATVAQLLKQNFYHLESWKKSGMLELAEEALAAGIEKRKDVHVVSTFGKEVWFACRFVPFQFKDEPHLLALFTDITERKRSEEVLKETEQKLRNIIEHSNELYYVHDTNHVLSYVSPQSLQILGYTPDEMMIEWTKLATDNPINKKGIELTLKALKTGKKQGIYLLELYKKDRSKVLLEIDESPLKDEQGNVIGIVGAARDVTERVKAEDALKKSEKHIHMLLDSTAEGIYGIDLEGNCTFVNAAGLRMLGYDDENELIGKNMHNMIHYKHPDGSPYPAEECRIFKAYKENKRIHDDTEVFWRKDGLSFPIEYRSFPIEEQGAVIIGAVITFLDITERKQEEELEDMRTEQKLLNKEALLHIMKSNIQDPEELWKFITLMGSQILGVDRVSIWFINNMRSEFICDALYMLTKHTHEKGFKIQVKHCPRYIDALSESRILPIENALADKRTIELSEDYLRPFGIISKMDVPVLRLGEVIGIISFEHTKERGWIYEDQDFAISLSHIITASLENFDRTRAEKSLRNSEKELKKRVKELEEFYEMAVGRELRIRDLKKEVEELKEELAKYKK